VNEKFKVTTETTLLPFLQNCFPKKSRNYVKGLLTRGQVRIGNTIAKHYAIGLRPGQVVTVLAAQSQVQTGPEISVIYEDDDIIVIDKPCGMLSISTDKEKEATAYHAVTDLVKSRSAQNRVFIVHRLDRETSGVMLFAKTELMKNLLQENWDELVTHRGYAAVVEGEPKNPEGRIVSWLLQTKTLLVYSSKTPGDGKKAITNYKTVKTSGEYSLLDVSLETGRKNQIRVHMKDLGNPVVGDKKYGAAIDPLKRLGLHASGLIVKHPVSGEIMRFEAKIPVSFMRLVK